MKPKAAFINERAENRLADAFDAATEAALREALEFPAETFLPENF